MPAPAQVHDAKGVASSKKKTWVAKADAVADTKILKGAVPAKPSKGGQWRAADAPWGGKGSKANAGKSSAGNGKSSNRGAWPTAQADKKQASSQLSINEVQQGLTKLLHQFKSASQDLHDEQAMSIQYQWPEEYLPWLFESMQQLMAWEEVQHPWGDMQTWAAFQTPPQVDSSLLPDLQCGSSAIPLSVIESDKDTLISEKIYGRGCLLHARRCLLCWPGGIPYDGPKWYARARPLELNIQVDAEETNNPGMPRSPPPTAPPSFKFDLDAPSFEPAPAWNASSEDLAATGERPLLTPDTSLVGYMPSYADDESMDWQASVEPYFPTYDANGMPLILPEVPAWPFAFVEESLTSYSTSLDAKFDGQDADDFESTAASSGQPSSNSQSPQHSPSTLDPITEAKARLQVEYYLSAENLNNDAYLCSKLDKDGWVTLDVLARFPRMQRIGIDVVGIVAALASSTKLEVSQDSPPRVRSTLTI